MCKAKDKIVVEKGRDEEAIVSREGYQDDWDQTTIAGSPISLWPREDKGDGSGSAWVGCSAKTCIKKTSYKSIIKKNNIK